MSPERWRRQKEIFSQVRSIGPELRGQLLSDLCGADQELRAELDRLLSAHDSGADSLLDEDGPAAPDWEAVAGLTIDDSGPALQPGDVLAGRFVLQRLAGEGGMGQVWVVHDRELNEAGAIKTIHRRIARVPGVVERFKRELQLARRIAHPNVCKVFDLFEDHRAGSTPRLFLTMELLDGETLSARLRREGRIVPAEATGLLGQLLAALGAAHHAGVIHRDLKPGNIMLVADPAGRERAVITDFGLARAAAVGSAAVAVAAAAAAGTEVPGSSPFPVTDSGMVIGTPDYMAPEQIRSEPATPATDIYALGLIYYEMLRGERPFASAKTPLAAWMQRIREAPPKLAGQIADLSPRADEFIAKALEYDPAARYASAEEAWQSLTGRKTATAPLLRLVKSHGPTAVAAALLAAFGLWGTWRFFSPGQTIPREALAWYQDAQRDLAEGAALRASNGLKRALAIAPRFAAAQAALAEASLELDQAAAAREAILRATDLAPDRSRLPVDQALHIEGVSRLILRDCAGATASLTQRTAAPANAEPALRSAAMVSLARAFERCDKPKDAERILAEAARLDPRNAAVLVRSAILAGRRRDHEGASRSLAEAESIYRARGSFEGVAEALVTRGTLETEHDQLDQAVKTLDEADALARTTGSLAQQIRILFQRAIVLRKRGQLSEAQPVAAHAVEMARNAGLETLALQGLFASANLHLVQGRYNEAEADFSHALEIAARYRDEESVARARLSLGITYDRQGRPDQVDEPVRAAAAYYESIKHGRNLAAARYVLGRTLFTRGRADEAAKLFREVLGEATRAQDADLEIRALQALADALAETGELSESANLLHRCVLLTQRVGRKRAEAFATLGWSEALSRLGRGAEARAQLAVARGVIASLDPDSRRAPEERLRLVEVFNAMRQDGIAKPPTPWSVTMKDESPSDRLAGLLANCTRALQNPAPARALTSCDEAMRLCPRVAHPAEIAQIQLLAARARLRAGDLAAGSRLAAAALGQAGDASNLTALAARGVLAAAASPGPQRQEMLTSVSRSLADLRLKMGNEQFGEWIRRADLGLLRPLSNEREAIQ